MMSKLRKALSSSVTWLALSLSLGYLSLMAMLMWLFEHAMTLDDLDQLFDNARLTRSWAVIGGTALGIFMVSRWALGRMSAHAPVPGAMTQISADAGIDPIEVQPKSLLAELIFLAALAAILAGTGTFIVKEQERSLDTARLRQFAIIGGAKARSVARWLDERQRDLLVLLDNPSFTAELAQWAGAAGRGVPLPATLHDNLQAVLDANALDGLSVLDSKGLPLLSLPKDLQSQAACRLSGTQAAPAASTEADKPQISFAFDNAKGRPKVDIISAVFDGQDAARRRVATLCMRVDLSQRLLPLVSLWPGVARSGEVLIGRPDGADIVWLNDRAGSDAAWHMTRLAGARADWEALALATQAGQLGGGLGAKGQSQLRSAYAVAGTPWLLLVRMDHEESEQLQSRNQMRVAVGLGFLLIFIVGALAVAWARSSYGRNSFHAQRDALLVQLRELAYFDELTSLPGRRLIQDRLDVALKDAERRKEQVGLMFIDLDKFKAINDRHGHAAGDAVLQACAKRLQASLRRNDSAGRLAGDEFLVILQGITGTAMLSTLRGKVAAALKAPVPWQGQSLSVGVSIGLAIYPEDATDAADLVAHADAAMYQQKQAAH